MLDKIWKFLKENIAVILAIATAVLATLYAALKLIIYVYWSGYFNKLSIHNSLISLKFEGFVFQVIFFGIILLCTIYLTFIVDTNFVNIFQKMWDKDRRLWGKVWCIIKIGFEDVLVSLIFLGIGNIPLVITTIVLTQKEITSINMIAFLMYFYILEIFLIITSHISENKKVKKEKTLEQKIGGIIFETLVWVSLFLAIMFFTGYQAIEAQKTIRLVENENYGITYSDGEIYVLHKVELKDSELIIYRDEQKVVSKEDYKYVVKHVEAVKVK